MDRYEVEMIRGPGYSPNVRVTISTDERHLFHAIMDAVSSVYDLWYNGELRPGDVIQVNPV